MIDKESNKNSKNMGLIKVHCPVCGSERRRILFSDRNRRENLRYYGKYVECCRCSLVYLTERVSWEEIASLYSSLDFNEKAAFDEIGKIYGVGVVKNRGAIYLNLKQILSKLRFRPHSWPADIVSVKSKTLLDLGCGNGAKLLEFASRGYDIWGVDVDNNSINLCRKLLPNGHFMQGELQKTGLPGSYFDHIRIDNVLEHVPNPIEVVRECYRLLKQGGQLFICTPHGRSLSMRLMKGNSIVSWIPFHLQLFTRKSLRYLMEEAGLKGIRIYGYYPYSWLPLSFVQWKSRKSNFTKFSYPSWLNLICYPLGWLCGKIGLAEELVGIGIKT